MATNYRADLAYIHDAGFSGYSLNAAPGILRYLRQNEANRGLVVDLGCGSGILARQLGFAGYRVLGIDQSGAMIRLARKNAPDARFVQASLVDAQLPLCSAVLCIGEVLSFAFAHEKDRVLDALFRRVYRSLLPGGIFLLDFGQTGRNPGGMPRSGHWSGADWAVLLEAEPSADNSAILTRRLTSFVRQGAMYRRSSEVHHLRLFDSGDLAGRAGRAGFETKILRSFGQLRFLSGHAGLFLRKPG